MAGLTILDARTLQVRAFLHKDIDLSVPYISGFLAYREAAPILALFEEAKTRFPELEIGAILVDGSGILHPRGCGLACHIGVATGLPTIGVCKKFLSCGGLDYVAVKEIEDATYDYSVTKIKRDGQKIIPSTCTAIKLKPTKDIEIYGDEYYAASMRTGNPLSTRPIYVSVGSNISLDDAIEIVKAVSVHRIPEPIRMADYMTRQVVLKEDKELQRKEETK